MSLRTIINRYDKMENGPLIGHRPPQAFVDPRNEMLKHLMWCIISAALMIFISFKFDLVNKCKMNHLSKKNAFRFSVMTFAFVAITGVYLYFGTIPGPDRPQQMIKNHPVLAYSMSAAAVMLLISTLILFLDILGPIGIAFYAGFWIFIFNMIFLLPF